ncbi:MAG TPA: DUF1365 domain-containing protein [Nocardioidaceae bacterium]|nr:DUF1365 domain-containing protein [Nocardioidaceae bacterium]
MSATTPSSGPVVPALVRAQVRHHRSRPVPYGFRTTTPMWLVDAADADAAFPRWLRPLASVRSRDHLDPADARPLVDKVRGHLAAEGVGWSAERVLVLANARSLGYVFDPLTTFFCLDGSGRLEGVLAEVHNTYGERHCYLLRLDGSRARVDKEFYVSPFFTVEGTYDIRVRLDADHVAISISLAQQGRTVFAGSVRGALRPATRGRTVRNVLGHPLPSQRVSALIRWHGVRLWLRRLPVAPRRPLAPKGTTSS